MYKPELPKINPDKKPEQKCTCRPFCPNRRRIWKGKWQKTSDELLLDRKPKPECMRRCPQKVSPTGPCPLGVRRKKLNVVERGTYPVHKVVRICQAPIDDQVDLTYLKHVQLAIQIGAWNAVKGKCAFCSCCTCCACEGADYHMRDAERITKRREDMRVFDKRVKTSIIDMQIMYDNK